ncbi:MAG: DUF4258 domain-containing protein [Candidatus Bathyarchaeota archaeon]|nr:DUF4258 domain-containing protein [Candidatus Bathyarchaeota archaeon]
MKTVPYMSVQFSQHALEKMHRRSVKTSDVYATMESPDEVYNDVEHGTIVAVKKIDARSIILAYKMEAEVVKVITLYYTTKLDRLIKTKTVRGAWKRVK